MTQNRLHLPLFAHRADFYVSGASDFYVSDDADYVFFYVNYVF